jgi:hypothetical protein
MTRKDYQLIASVLSQFTGDQGDVIDRDAVAYDLADALAADNPRFDRERFLIASGVYYKCDHCQSRATAFGTGHQWCALHKGRGLVKNWTPDWALNN